ncbi:flavodoxin family protein [Clostridium malenominatum]|uniref:Flavodoxin family protein n=1 Tax=Clostridium malenominatum TaxID=1539 RepID=A0ABN1IM89_9CLOT
MKKVLAINSSIRKNNTFNLLKKIEKKLNEKDIMVDFINLKDYNIKECVGCELCITKDICNLNDDMDILMNKLKNYDGIIISTPVYMSNLSGKLKVFLDRTCRWFHRPELTGCPILLVSTTAGSGLKDTFLTLEKIMYQWGAFPVGKIGRSLGNLNEDVKDKDIDNFVMHLYMDKCKFKPNLNQLINFQVQKVLAVKILTFDRKYWEDKDWISKDYFFNAKIPIVSKIISRSFYKMLYKKVNPVNNNF